MQLNRHKPIRGALTAATCTLLGSGATTTNAASGQDWEFDSAVLFYKEVDRVSVVEPVFSARAALGDDAFFNIRLVLDTLSGASPNGAIPYSAEQTFSGPSGGNSYTVPANQTPLDPTFEDQRGAGSISLEKPLGTDLKGIFGANASQELDYTSLGLSAAFSLDVNNKLTTLTAGAAINFDTVSPSGGAPEPFSEVSTIATSGGENENENEDEGEDGEDDGKSKTVTDFLLGITQVLSRNTLMQVNYSYGESSGYLTDPYKILSVVDANTGVLVPGHAIPPSITPNEFLYLHENRPDLRTRQSLYLKLNHQFTDDVVYLSFRHYWDDWGITSRTVDLRYRFELGHKHYLQPHLRYYQQTAADFYRYFLIGGTIPEYASADYRLGDMTTTTVGLLYGVELTRNSEFTVRVEQITQSGESHPAEAFGTLLNYDLFPDVKASLVQLSYRFSF